MRNPPILELVVAQVGSEGRCEGSDRESTEESSVALRLARVPSVSRRREMTGQSLRAGRGGSPAPARGQALEREAERRGWERRQRQGGIRVQAEDGHTERIRRGAGRRRNFVLGEEPGEPAGGSRCVDGERARRGNERRTPWVSREPVPKREATCLARPRPAVRARVHSLALTALGARGFDRPYTRSGEHTGRLPSHASSTWRTTLHLDFHPAGEMSFGSALLFFCISSGSVHGGYRAIKHMDRSTRKRPRTSRRPS